MKTPAKLLRDAIEAARQKVAPPQPVPNHDIAVLRRDQSGKVIGLKTPDGDDVDVVLVQKNPTGGIDFSGANTAPVIGADGLTVRVGKFDAGPLKFAGGSLSLVQNGTWFVGVDLFRGVLIALPRLGHRGWVPVARVTTNASEVTSISAIAPQLPASRIPRTIKKILDGKAISVVVMGSSLTQGGNTTDWPGMLFNSASSLSNYRVPGSISAQYRGVGGSPNQYQLAQTGLGGFNGSLTYGDASAPRIVSSPLSLPNGRSTMFSGVDLVVLGCLANGGDYRLECIEPIVRNLRKLGVEVILVSDNPQGPTSAYSSLSSSSLYVDGQDVKRIADLYGVEFADTAAFVFEAHLRYGAGIYSDTIHMASGSPAGRTAAPSCGHEVWARAVRSVIPVEGAPAAPVSVSYDFSTGLQGFAAYSAAAVDASSGALVITKNTAAQNQWGGWITSLPAIYAGDTVRVRGVATGTSGNGVSIGLQNAGWASNSVAINDGAFDVTLTCTVNSTALLFYGGNNNAANGASFSVDNVVIDITHNSGAATDIVPGRQVEYAGLPPSRVVSDYKTPGDAHVILPADDQFIWANSAQKGTLGAHPWGSGSFARCFSSAVGASQDLLTVSTGQQCGFAANAVVGLSLIRYADQNDAACTVDVYRNNNKLKTLTLTPPPFGNEWYTTIFTPTEYAQTSSAPSIDQVTLVVTSGTLKVAAFVALTAEIDFVTLEGLTFVGAWPYSENDGGTNTRGKATDTVGDYAYLKCPPNARRVQFLCANRSNSQNCDFFSGREKSLNVSMSGANHIRAKGGLLGPGEIHAVKLPSAAPSPAAGNRSLHVSGAVIIYDR